MLYNLRIINTYFLEVAYYILTLYFLNRVDHMIFWVFYEKSDVSRVEFTQYAWFHSRFLWLFKQNLRDIHTEFPVFIDQSKFKNVLLLNADDLH